MKRRTAVARSQGRGKTESVRLRVELLESRYMFSAAPFIDLNGPDEPGTDYQMSPAFLDSGAMGTGWAIDADAAISDPDSSSLRELTLHAAPGTVPWIHTGTAIPGLCDIGEVLQDAGYFHLDAGGPRPIEDFLAALRSAWVVLQKSTEGPTYIEVYATDDQGNTSNTALITLADGPIGSRADTVGLFDPERSEMLLRYSNTMGFAERVVSPGRAGQGWIPLSGDWDGDGTETVGLYDPTRSFFYLSNGGAMVQPEVAFGYGVPKAGWLPVVGDWNYDRIDTIGLYDPATAMFYLRDSNTTGVSDYAFGYGTPGRGQVPLAGNWFGGQDAVGVYTRSNGTFELCVAEAFAHWQRYSTACTFAFGPTNSTWLPVAGDWTGQGFETIGLYDPATSRFYLRNSHTTGYADLTVPYGQPGAGWLPIVGDWNSPDDMALRSVAPAIEDSNAAAIQASDWAPLLARALADWNSAGVDAQTAQRLAAVDVAIADLPDRQLGWAAGGTIYLDRNAAGHGWFVDPTPWADEEFQADSGGLRALDAQAADRMDLLTVLEHELGHAAGLVHSDLASGDLMSPMLSSGLRRVAR